ncbi:hypothetical protein PIB30_071639 [Stylosanthes scabra]|uniref:Uncharacterized protein n=1 Tax=Stylosanthes scabra TaxID=79078 RepID=A0ABU6VNA9_9FABA|nr:hypothetical protein [Stylosanthes scabra]
MVTKAGLETRCMSRYLEDLKGNKMKCTVFGNLVGNLLALSDAATQGIAHVESQPQYSAEDELEGGARSIN